MSASTLTKPPTTIALLRGPLVWLAMAFLYVWLTVIEDQTPPMSRNRARTWRAGSHPSSPSASRVTGRRRLGGLLAVAAGELHAHRLNPLSPNHLQRLGHVLVHLRQPLQFAAAGARLRRGHHHTLAWQKLGEGLASRPAPLEHPDLGLPCPHI